MAYTEFYCQPSADNMNAGSSPYDGSDFTYASGTWNVAANVGTFTVASGNPLTDVNANTGVVGIPVGSWASVYPDGTTGDAVFVGRVTSRTSTTIVMSSINNKGGTAPANGTTNTTLKIGGAWKGPNGTSWFPFAFVVGSVSGATTNSMTNSSGDYARVNFKAGTDYTLANGTPLTGVTGTAATDLLTTTGTAPKTGEGFVINTGGAGFGGLQNYANNTFSVYWAINVSATTWKAATSYANAIAGTAVDITSDGTGATVTPIPAGPTTALAGPVFWEGYTTTPGDMALAGTFPNITGSTSDLPFPGLTINAIRHEMKYLKFTRNGAMLPSGPNANGDYMVRTASGGVSCKFYRLRFEKTWRDGLRNGGPSGFVEECEAYDCNVDSGNTYASFNCSSSTTYLRCWSHHSLKSGDAGDPGFGFQAGTGLQVVYDSCISSHNGGRGFMNMTGSSVVVFKNCIAYGNACAGIEFATGQGINSTVTIENCAFINNGNGVSGVGTKAGVGYLSSTWGAYSNNNAFYNNSAGNYVSGISSLNTNDINLGADPFADGTNGDFSLNNNATGGFLMRGTGAEVFPNTIGGYTDPTVSYPDVGAAQHLDSGGGADGGQSVFSG